MKTKFIFLVVLLIGTIGSLKTFGQENNLSFKNKKVLIVYGGWDGHKPKAFVDKIQPWLESEGAEVLVSDSLGVYLNEELLSSQDLIIQSWTAGRISKEEVQGLLKAVKSGVGFAGCHGGIGDSFREPNKNEYYHVVEYYLMVGGIWVAHPGNTIKHTINIVDHVDGVTKGLKDFELETEQYYMHVDPNVKVLATTTFSGEHSETVEGCVMPVAWKKNFYKGRVFYYSVGHNMEDYDVPESKAILERGFSWAVQSKYEEKENCIVPIYKNYEKK